MVDSTTEKPDAFVLMFEIYNIDKDKENLRELSQSQERFSPRYKRN
jgi:hypothetical protein